jgi:hypothetical protein
MTSESKAIDDIVKNVPSVITESVYSKNYKIVLTVAIIILLLWYTFDHNNIILCLDESNKYNEYMTDIQNINKIDNTKSIVGQYIQIAHNNKKILPIHKIVIIDSNRNIVPIYTKNAKKINTGKNGMILEYTLAKPTHISQIIIDVNVLDIQSKNITTSSLKIKNKDHKTVWVNSGILYLSKLIEININTPAYIYPINQERLDHRHNSNEQEFILKNRLIENTWI